MMLADKFNVRASTLAKNLTAFVILECLGAECIGADVSLSHVGDDQCAA
jgi:hypothetical protein